MAPSQPDSPDSLDTFRSRLVYLIDLRHELCRFVELIGWSALDRESETRFQPGMGLFPGSVPSFADEITNSPRAKIA